MRFIEATWLAWVTQPVRGRILHWNVRFFLSVPLCSLIGLTTFKNSATTSSKKSPLSNFLSILKAQAPFADNLELEIAQYQKDGIGMISSGFRVGSWDSGFTLTTNLELVLPEKDSGKGNCCTFIPKATFI